MKKQLKLGNLEFKESFKEEFSKIYSDHFDRLYYFALSFTKSDDLAKDVVSEVFLKLWKKRNGFSGIRQIESYLYISVKNEAIQVLSNNLNKVKSLEFEQAARVIDRIDPEELLIEKELVQEISQVVSKLPDQCQLIFNMAKNRQMKYKEIAEELNISVSTVRMQLIKASGIIKDAIQKKYDDPSLAIGSVKMGMINLLPMVLMGF